MKAKRVYISGTQCVFYGMNEAIYWRIMASATEHGPYKDTVQAVQSAINTISQEGKDHDRQVTYNS